MSEYEKKLESWLAENPEGYYTLPMKEIADAADITVVAAQRILPRMIAKREGILPSQQIPSSIFYLAQDKYVIHYTRVQFRDSL